MNSDYNLDKSVLNDIICLAQKCGIKRIVLFGSRARGDNRKNSDIDLAISGGNINRFKAEIDDEVNTLLMFDVLNLDTDNQKDILKSIRKDGIVIYEKI